MTKLVILLVIFFATVDLAFASISSTPFFIDDVLYSNSSIYAVGNVTSNESDWEENSSGFYTINGTKSTTYSFTEVRTLWSGYQGYNSSVWYDSGNHDGIPPRLNCTTIKENCVVDFGHNTTKYNGGVGGWNDSLYYMDFVDLYGARQNLSEYVNVTGSYITMWIYVENITTLEYLQNDNAYNPYILRFYFTGSSTDWQSAFKYDIQKGDLQEGWNLYYRDLGDVTSTTCTGDPPNQCNTSRINFMAFHWGNEFGNQNEINVSLGDWKIGDIKIGKGYPFLRQYEADRGDPVGFNYTVCGHQSGCTSETTLTDKVLQDSPPIQYFGTKIDGSINVDGLVYCHPGTYFDHDTDALSTMYVKFFLNGGLVSTQSSVLLNLADVAESVGDVVSCSVTYETQLPNGTKVNSSEYSSSNETVLGVTRINVDRSLVIHNISEWIYGQGNSLRPQRSSDTAFDPTTRTFIEEQLNASITAGFTSTRWGGCDANWYVWYKCYVDDTEGFWGKGCGGTWEYYNCSQDASNPYVLLNDIYNYSVQLGVGMVEFTTQVSNNGTNTTPSTHVNGSYSAGFVNYTNINQSWNITFWEIGNEVSSSTQYGDDTNATRYAEEFIDHCTSMKAVDPSVKCGLVLTSLNEEDDAGNNWNREVMRVAGNYSDYFVDHPYEGSQLPNSWHWFQTEDYEIVLIEDGNWSFGVYAMSEGSSVRITVQDYENVLVDQYFGDLTYSDNGHAYSLQETNTTFMRRGLKTVTIAKSGSYNTYVADPRYVKYDVEEAFDFDSDTRALFYCNYTVDLNCTSRYGTGTPVWVERDVPTGGPIWIPEGKFGGGFINNNSADEIWYNVTDNINFSSGTIAFWVYDIPGGNNYWNYPEERMFFNYGTTWSTSTFQFLKGTGPNNNVVFRSYNSSGYPAGISVSFPSNRTTDGGANLSEGVWYHLAATWDCSQFRLYLDGVLMDDEDLPGCWIEDWGHADFSVGSYHDGSNPVRMRMDDLVVFDTALTTEEIKELIGQRIYYFNITNFTAQMEADLSPHKQMEHDLANISATSAIYMNHTNKIHATEWLCHPTTLYYPGWGEWETRWWVCDGLSNALHFHALMENDDYEAAHMWIPSSGGVGRNPSTFYWTDLQRRTPQYWVMNMFSQHSGNQLLNATQENTRSFTYSDLGDILDVEYINSVATVESDGSALYLNVINSEEKNRTVEINISGFGFSSNVTIYTLKGDSYDDKNQYDEHIQKETTYQTIIVPIFNYTLEPLSIVTFEFRSGCVEPQENTDWIVVDSNCSWSSRNIDIGTGKFICTNCRIDFEDINITVNDWSVENGRIGLTPPFKFASR